MHGIAAAAAYGLRRAAVPAPVTEAVTQPLGAAGAAADIAVGGKRKSPDVIIGCVGGSGGGGEPDGAARDPQQSPRKHARTDADALAAPVPRALCESPVLTAPEGWVCRRCTFRNTETGICGACNFARPDFPLFADARSAFWPPQLAVAAKRAIAALYPEALASIIVSYSVWMPLRGDRCDAMERHTNVWRVAQVMEVRLWSTMALSPANRITSGSGTHLQSPGNAPLAAPSAAMPAPPAVPAAAAVGAAAAGAAQPVPVPAAPAHASEEDNDADAEVAEPTGALRLASRLSSAFKSVFQCLSAASPRRGDGDGSGSGDGDGAYSGAPARVDVLVHFLGCDLLWDRWVALDSGDVEPHGVHTRGQNTSAMLTTQTKTEQMLAMGFTQWQVDSATEALGTYASTEELAEWLLVR